MIEKGSGFGFTPPFLFVLADCFMRQGDFLNSSRRTLKLVKTFVQTHQGVFKKAQGELDKR